MTRASFILSLALLAGCHAPVCTTAATRCAPHDTVEVCDGRGQWRPVAECSAVAMHSGGEWTCGTVNDVAACLPEGGR